LPEWHGVIVEKLRDFMRGENVAHRLLWADVVGRKAQHGVLDQDMESELTILIVVDLFGDLTGEVDGSLDIDTDTLRPWRTVLSKLSSLLFELRISVPIEIIDLNAFHGFFISPVLSTDTQSIQAWKDLREKVVEAIEGTQWRSLDVVHQALRAGTGRGSATVLITAKDAEQPAWSSEILPRIRGILGNVFAVGLVWGDVVRSGDESAADKKEEESKAVREFHQTVQDPRISMDAFTKDLTMGASIGRAGGTGSRTAGGLIQLDYKGQILDLILTNHHVLTSAEVEQGMSKKGNPKEQPKLTSSLAALAEEQNRTPPQAGLPPTHELITRKALAVVSPSEKDTAEMKAWLAYNAKATARTLGDKKLQADTGLGIRSRKVEYERLLAETSQIGKDQQTVGDFDPALGHVFATSGFATMENPQYDIKTTRAWSAQHADTPDGLLGWDADWSLIEPTVESSMSSMIQRTSHGVKIPRGTSASKWVPIDKDTGYDVAKVGRSTGWTTGVINAVESILACRAKSPHDKHTLCHVVLRNSDHDFGVEGDSGALIMLDQTDDDAQVVGLLFGANASLHLIYMAPIELIINNIEHVTGGKVVYPQMKECEKITADDTADEAAKTKQDKDEEEEQSPAEWIEWI
jgi:hypothetical protein